MASTFVYRRGETIIMLLEVLGDASAMTGAVCTAELKAAIALGGVPAPDVAAIANFDITVASTTNDPTALPGWWLTIDAETSADFAPGTYCSNAVLTFSDGTVEKSDPLYVRIEQATS